MHIFVQHLSKIFSSYKLKLCTHWTKTFLFPLLTLRTNVLVGGQSLSFIWLFVTPWTADVRLPYPSLSPVACSNSCPLSQWCHPTISSSVVPFSSCLHSFPAPGSSLVSWLFASGGKSIWVSVSAPVLPANVHSWFSSELTGLISLQSKGLLSRVFSNTTFQKHQFFSAQPSLWSDSHIHTWLLEKPSFWLDRPLSSNVSAF